MSRQTSTDLFELIRSLSSDEKRYFRTLTSSRTRNEEAVIYVQVFDMIDKQKEYDEEKILLKLKKVSPTYFSRIKNYLYNLILKNIEVFHAPDSVETELRILQSQIRVLYYKGLYRHCEKIIQKAKKLAYTYELYYPLIEILGHESLILDRLPHSGVKLYDSQNAHKEQLHIIKQYENIRQYSKLVNYASYTFNKIGYPRNNEQMNQYTSIMQHSLLRDEKKATSIFSKIEFCNAHMHYHFVLNEPEKAYKYIKRKIELLESNPVLIAFRGEAYANSLYAEIAYYLYTDNFACFEPALQKMKDIPSMYGLLSEQRLIASIFIRSYILELNYYYAKGEFKKIHSIINPINKGLALYKDKIGAGFRRMLYYNIARVYFGAEEYRQSSRWLNKILNDPSEIMPDYIIFSKILRIIICYEMQDFDLLSYSLKAVYRYLYKKNKVYKFETLLLEFIRELKVDSEKDILKLFISLRKELMVLSKHKYEKFPFMFFDFTSWLDSKIEGRAFAEIIRRKLNAHVK